MALREEFEYVAFRFGLTYYILILFPTPKLMQMLLLLLLEPSEEAEARGAEAGGCSREASSVL